MTGPVRLEVDGAVGVIRLDRPPVNAINRALQAGLLAAAKEVSDRDDIRAVVLYGGERVFAAGADIAELSRLTVGEIRAQAEGLNAAITAVARLRVPVVAAITGYALGGGLEVALAADLRIVADDALLGLPEVGLGVLPGGGGTQRLPRLIGTGRAKELIFTGRTVRGAEAVTLGLATVAVARDQVFATARSLAGRLAAGPTVALALAKRAIDEGIDTDLDAGLRLEADCFAAVFDTADQRTGMASFLEHGPGKATFVGR